MAKLFAEKSYRNAQLEFRNAAKVQPKDAEPLYQIALVNLMLDGAMPKG